jgi:predicted dehydrogenase
MDFEDSATVLLRFNSGTLAGLNVGWYSQDYTLRLDLLGTVKSASVTHLPPPTLPMLYQMLTKGMSSFTKPHFDELQYFVDCLQNDVNPSPTGLDGLRDLEAIAQAYKNSIEL